MNILHIDENNNDMKSILYDFIVITLDQIATSRSILWHASY